METQRITMGRTDGLRTQQERDYQKRMAGQFIETALGIKQHVQPGTLQYWLCDADTLTTFATKLVEAVVMGKMQTAEELAGTWLREAADLYGSYQADRLALAESFK